MEVVKSRLQKAKPGAAFSFISREKPVQPIMQDITSMMDLMFRSFLEMAKITIKRA
jgi:hypothetical protein